MDWTVVASFLGSPLVTPFFAIVNVLIGYVLIICVVMPIAYWGLNVYNAKTFPIFSAGLFTAQGQYYNITAIVNDKFEIDRDAYDKQGRVNLSSFFALTYGFGFATIASTLTHVGLFYGRYCPTFLSVSLFLIIFLAYLPYILLLKVISKIVMVQGDFGSIPGL